MTLDRLTFQRESERRTSDDKLQAQLEFIANRAFEGIGSYRRGWGYEIGSIEAQQSLGIWIFTAWIRFYRTHPLDEEKETRQRRDIYSWAAAAGNNARFGPKPWKTRLEDPRKAEVPTEGDKVGPDSPESASDDPTPNHEPFEDPEPVPLSSIREIPQRDFFRHLYGIDAQIRLVLSAVQAAADSEMRNRFHCLLHGRPGAGKTEVLLSLSSLLTELRISHLMIDATSTTEAGMKKALLDEDEIVPQVILIEEIEKCPGNSHHWLLGLMDQRATVTQLNFRRSASRRIEALVIGSANDFGLMQKRESGALLSRFSSQIYFPRPSRENLARILQRKIAEVKHGDESWIEPTLRYCYDERGITDPRMIIKDCLQGKSRLLTGEYQRDLEATIFREPSSETVPNLTAFED